MAAKPTSQTDRSAASAPDPPDSPLLQKSPSQQSIEQDVMLIVLRLQTIKEEIWWKISLKAREKLLSNKRPYARYFSPQFLGTSDSYQQGTLRLDS